MHNERKCDSEDNASLKAAMQNGKQNPALQIKVQRVQD